MAFSEKRRILFCVAQGWIFVVITGSLQPHRPLWMMHWHRQTHLLAFAGAAFLLLFSFRTIRQRIRSAACLVIPAVLLELCQHMLYHGPIEWRDVADDTLAVFLCVGGILWRMRQDSLRA
jgi:hypothetical protein